MTPEDRTSKLVLNEISQPELVLQELNNSIWNTQKYLMATFFQDDTWRVRQGSAYGFPLLEYIDGGKDHDWDKEHQIVDSVFEDLGERQSYYEAAYHFPDVLSAFGVGSGKDWVEMIAKNSGESKSQVAKQILPKIQDKLARETSRFGEFLGSEVIQRAFTIKVDRITGEYTITDLKLDRDELEKQWNKMVGKSELNPIKAVGLHPDDFIAHQFSGAPPEILGCERSKQPLVDQLGISYIEANLNEVEMLARFDAWESTYISGDKDQARELSKEFQEVYGFSPEDLEAARLARRKEEFVDK